jgi:streptogramin lyase
MKRGFITVLALVWIAIACSDRQRLNPLDPQAEFGVGSVGQLESMAGDGQVQLGWDYSQFDDVEGYLLYKRPVGGEFALLTRELLPPTRRQFVDAEVANGTSYEYRMGLVISGEGERGVGEIALATPGPEVAWVADRGTGLVWKVNADGRSARFARGRFFDLRDIAVDGSNGSCWISDGASQALFRINAAGELERLGAALEMPDELEIDAVAGVGWVSDLKRREVFWFSLAPTDTLEFFVVDASLAEPSGLAAFSGACWIVDRQQGRAFLYSTSGRRIVEFRSLNEPGYIDVGSDGSAWVLVDDGSAMVRLDLDGGSQEVVLPFQGARSLAVNRRDGTVWVLAEGELALYARNGQLIQQWSEVPAGRALAFDPAQDRAWIATQGALWKFSPEGETVARLEGFSSMVRVAVDSGGR